MRRMLLFPGKTISQPYSNVADTESISPPSLLRACPDLAPQHPGYFGADFLLQRQSRNHSTAVTWRTRAGCGGTCYSPSYPGGQGGRIAWVREFLSPAWATSRPCLKPEKIRKFAWIPHCVQPSNPQSLVVSVKSFTAPGPLFRFFHVSEELWLL